MAIDANTLLQQIVDALHGEISTGWRRASAFARTQGEIIAHQAAFIAESRAFGSLRHKDQLFVRFVDKLKELTANFARALAQLTIITLEKAWNAVTGLVWGAINDVLTGSGLLKLPIPKAPRP